MLDPKRQAAQELHAIRLLMEQTRQTRSDSWIFFIVWGTGGMIAAIASQILLGLSRWDLSPIPQGLYWPICIGVSLWLVNRRMHAGEPIGFVERIVAATWFAITMTMLALVAACALGLVPRALLGALLAIEAGVGCFVTAAMIDVRPLLPGRDRMVAGWSGDAGAAATWIRAQCDPVSAGVSGAGLRNETQLPGRGLGCRQPLIFEKSTGLSTHPHASPSWLFWFSRMQISCGSRAS